jgi:HD-GYP domain-containing protein (c-di-GMP phosphodiesterase class II)
MRKTKTEDLKPGQRVARTLYYDYGGVMLAAGAELSPKSISRLEKFGFTYIYVYDAATEDVVVYEEMDERARGRLTGKVRKLFDDIKHEIQDRFEVEELSEDLLASMQERIQKDELKEITRGMSIGKPFQDELGGIIEKLLTDREVCLTVGSVKTVDGYIFDHSVDVAIKALHIAKRAGFRQHELEQLAMGCLLHDVGYLCIPEDVRKAKKLNAKDVELLKQHTVYGYHLLKEDDNVHLLSAHVAFQHHERQDGRGFPRGLRGTNKLWTKHEQLMEGGGYIHRYAAIAAVANYYDYLISDLTYKPAIPPDEAMAKVKESAGTFLNREVVEIFVDFMPVFPVGTVVLVTDGEYRGYKGVVTHITPESLDQPKIRLLSALGKDLSEVIDIDLQERPMAIKAVF